MSHDPKSEPVHWFLDEAGDAVFYGKGRVPIIGNAGVSLAFSLGKAVFFEDLEDLRARVRALQTQVESHPEWGLKPSVVKKKNRGGFHFHATDDPPPVRELMFDFIEGVNCRFDMIVARKNPAIFQGKHHGREESFYADLLGWLLGDSLSHPGRIVLNIAKRGNTTKQHHLDEALARAKRRFRGHAHEMRAQVSFNVQPSANDPLLSITDYLCWSVHRVFERGDLIGYERVRSKINLVVDHFDAAGHEGGERHYRHPARRLGVENKISPPSP